MHKLLQPSVRPFASGSEQSNTDYNYIEPTYDYNDPEQYTAYSLMENRANDPQPSTSQTSEEDFPKSQVIKKLR